MLSKLRPRSAYDVIALIALFVAVGGGTAFAVVAANQVNSESIIDGQVKKQDLATGSVGTAKVIDDALLSGDIKEGEIKKGDLASGSVGAAKVIDNSLTGDDIDEGKLRRFQHGRARYAAVPANAAPATILSWPALGVRVTNTPGSGSNQFILTVRNTRPSGGGNIYLALQGSTYSLPPGDSSNLGLDGQQIQHFMVVDPLNQDLALLVECGYINAAASVEYVHCFGTRSQDD